MDRIKIGQVVNVVGLKGELKVYHYSDYKERFEELTQIYLENTRYKIAGVRYIKEIVILKLAGIDNRTEAEKHKGEDVYIDKADVRELPEDTYYIFDLIGLNVIDESGAAIGTLCDVIQNSAQDLYEIERQNKDKFLIPAVEEFILKIDMESRTMMVRLIEGLMEESKFGITSEETGKLIEDILERCPNIRIRGLMCIAPFEDDPEDVRVFFRETKMLYEKYAVYSHPRLEFRYLSMGMSHDYEAAILEGSNLIRVGTAIFGERNYNKQI